MTRPLRFLALLAVLFAGAARADTPPGLIDYPTEIVLRPLTLPKSVVEFDLGLGLGLNSYDAFQPMVPSLGIVYGITDSIQLSGDFAFCFNGPSGCASVANYGGVQITDSIIGGNFFNTAVFVGFNFVNFAPIADSQLSFGAELRLHVVPDLIAIVAIPSLNLGLNDRGATNFDTINIPIAVQVQVTKKLELQLGTGIDFFINPPEPTSIGDSVTIPLSFGATYAVSNQFDFGANFNFVNLFGRASDFPQGFDYRTLTIFIAYRL